MEGRLGTVWQHNYSSGSWLLFVHGCVHGHYGNYSDWLDGRALEMGKFCGLGFLLRHHLLPAICGVDVGWRMVGKNLELHVIGCRLRRLCRLWCCARSRWSSSIYRSNCVGATHWKVWCGRQAAHDCWSSRANGDARNIYFVVRMVWF